MKVSFFAVLSVDHAYTGEACAGVAGSAPAVFRRKTNRGCSFSKKKRSSISRILSSYAKASKGLNRLSSFGEMRRTSSPYREEWDTHYFHSLKSVGVGTISLVLLLPAESIATYLGRKFPQIYFNANFH